jgi:hypothetical protein
MLGSRLKLSQAISHAILMTLFIPVMQACCSNGSCSCRKD